MTRPTFTDELLKAENKALKEALTPSGETKAAYIGEFTFRQCLGEKADGSDYIENLTVPWTTIKEIMKAISARALKALENDND